MNLRFNLLTKTILFLALISMVLSSCSNQMKKTVYDTGPRIGFGLSSGGQSVKSTAKDSNVEKEEASEATIAEQKQEEEANSDKPENIVNTENESKEKTNSTAIISETIRDQKKNHNSSSENKELVSKDSKQLSRKDLAKQERAVKRQKRQIKRLKKVIKVLPEGQVKSLMNEITSLSNQDDPDELGKKKPVSPLAIAAALCALAMILLILMAFIQSSIFPIFGLFALFAATASFVTGILGLREVKVYKIRGKNLALIGVITGSIIFVSIGILFIVGIISLISIF